MRKPYMVAASVTALALGISHLTTEASAYPVPTSTTVPGEIPAGICVLVGDDLPPVVSVPEPVEMVNLLLHCQITEDSYRVLSFPVHAEDEATVLTLTEVLERLDIPEDDDEFVPQ